MSPVMLTIVLSAALAGGAGAGYLERQVDGLQRARDRANPADTRRLAAVDDTIARIQQLRQDPRRPFVLVNIAEQRLYVIEGDRVAMSMRAIVGKPESPTPVVDSRIERVVLNPDWVIPRGPAFAQALAAARENPGYLEEHNIEVVRGDGGIEAEVDPRKIDWTQVSSDTFRFGLRQHPGAGNPLGRLLFAFPNEYGIHIHDTPAREAFEEGDRRKSLGCVRVERAAELAAFLLKDRPRWPPEKIRRAVLQGGPRTIWLGAPVDVHVVDWTAWIDGGGALQVREEPYRALTPSEAPEPSPAATE